MKAFRMVERELHHSDADLSFFDDVGVKPEGHDKDSHQDGEWLFDPSFRALRVNLVDRLAFLDSVVGANGDINHQELDAQKHLNNVNYVLCLVLLLQILASDFILLKPVLLDVW